MDSDSGNEKSSHPIMVEAALLLGLMAGGFWLVPAMVYLTGDAVLGPYGADQGMGRFYLDLFGMLVQGNGLVWLLLCAPYLTLMMLRLLIWIWRSLNRPGRENGQPVADQ